MDDTSMIAGDLGEARKARASRPKQADAADRLQVPRNRTLQIGPCTDNEPPQLQSTIVLGMTRVQLSGPSRARDGTVGVMWDVDAQRRADSGSMRKIARLVASLGMRNFWNPIFFRTDGTPPRASCSCCVHRA